MESTVESIRFVIATFLKNLGQFFSPKVTPGEKVLTTDEIAINAALCMLVGITLQDKFISGLEASNSDWFDRGLQQAVFWVFLFLLVGLMLLAMGVKKVGPVGLRAVFITVPIAFLFGTYAASLGHFVKLVIESVPGMKAQVLPQYCNIAVQCAIVVRYFPGELRASGQVGKWQSRAVTAILFAVILAVDIAVIWSRKWGA